MKMKIAVAAVTSIVGLGLITPSAEAYVRNVAPVITSVTCNFSGDQVTVSWSKDAGKPAVVQVFKVGTGSYFQQSIPGSRGSKGNWTFSVASAFDLLPEDQLGVELITTRSGFYSGRFPATCT